MPQTPMSTAYSVAMAPRQSLRRQRARSAMEIGGRIAPRRMHAMYHEPPREKRRPFGAPPAAVRRLRRPSANPEVPSGCKASIVAGGHTGAHALRIAGNGEFCGVVVPAIPMKADERYVVAAW